jgi:hypothetical protein
MVKCICIDDKNRPADFPKPDKWVKEEAQYHIVNIKFVTESQCLGFQLAEIDMEDCFPYLFFMSHRFMFDEADLPALLEMMKQCKEKADSSIDLIDFSKYLDKVKVREKEKVEELEHA